MNENQLQVFTHEQFGKLRLVFLNGKEYFVAKDIATALGYSNPRDAIIRHCKGVVKHDSFKESGNQISLIPEGDIYRLIIKSQLPSAEKFETWVFDEVIPTIRKHGTYMTEEVIEKTLTDPDFIIQLATQLKEEKIKRLEAEKRIEESKPLVTFAETCLKSKDNILMRELAKVANDEGINIGQNRLYDKLREWKLIMAKPSTEPYQTGMNAGYFVVEEKSVETPYGTKLTSTTKVTPKGQVYIIEKLKKELDKI